MGKTNKTSKNDNKRVITIYFTDGTVNDYPLYMFNVVFSNFNTLYQYSDIKPRIVFELSKLWE